MVLEYHVHGVFFFFFFFFLPEGKIAFWGICNLWHRGAKKKVLRFVFIKTLPSLQE